MINVVSSPLWWCQRGAACTGASQPPWKSALYKYLIITVICSLLRWCLCGAACTGNAQTQAKILHYYYYYYYYLLTFAVVSPQCRVTGGAWPPRKSALYKYLTIIIITIICSPLRCCLRGAVCTGGAQPPGKNISLLLLLSAHLCSCA